MSGRAEGTAGGDLPGNAFCTRCGTPLEGDHVSCRAALAWEPPRFCPRCRRRLVVQVTPYGWTARCSEHGTWSSR